ncbi:MAG: ArsR family transcriptional regulator [Solirubrobacteraceae bacterium]
MSAASRAANALAEVAVPARLAILAALFAPRDPEEIAYLLKLSAATVSEHLAVLRRRGLGPGFGARPRRRRRASRPGLAARRRARAPRPRTPGRRDRCR